MTGTSGVARLWARSAVKVGWNEVPRPAISAIGNLAFRAVMWSETVGLRTRPVWEWDQTIGLGLGVVNSGLGFGLGFVTLVLVLRIWSYLHHWFRALFLGERKFPGRKNTFIHGNATLVNLHLVKVTAWLGIQGTRCKTERGPQILNDGPVIYRSRYLKITL